MSHTATFAAAGDGTEDEDITELEKFSPERVDGVTTPANGFPILLVKQAAPGGEAMDNATGDAVVKDDGDRDGDGENALPGGKDDGPDDGDGAAEKATADGGTADAGDAQAAGDSAQDVAKDALDPDGWDAVRDASPADREAYLAALTAHRAAEPLGKGASTGTEYLQAQRAWRLWSEHADAEGLDGTREGAARWLAKHGTGPVPVAESAPEAAAVDEPVIATPEAAEAMLKAVMDAEAPVYKRDIDAATRRRLASEHKALPNGSYPIETVGDLDNAARLARSGHGDVSGAKALIRRRAKELGVANPLDDGNEAKKADGDDDDDDAPKGRKCPMCKGTGKIRGGNMTCPKCKGKGVLPPKAAKGGNAAAVATAAIKATLAAGIISQEAADDLIAQIEGETAKAAGPGARPVPATTVPAAGHREPDGTSTVEQIEPDAGLPTDADSTPDKVPASVAALAMKEAPYEVARLHDALCAAYSVDAVLEAYPAMKSVADAVDPGWFTKQAQDALAAGRFDEVSALASLAAAAQAVKGFSGAAVDDARALLHKSFSDMYPDEKIKPQMGIKPGSFQRPYLSAGHAAANSGGWTVNVPPSTHTPEPGDYERGYLTAGHAAPSPADHGPNNPAPPDAGGREFYSTSEKDMAGAAMRSMHDHIAATYAGCCPMAPSRTVMPPGMGATNTPSTTMPHAQGGVATVKAAGEDMGGTPALSGSRKIKGHKGMGKKKIAKMLEQALRNSGTNLLGPAEVEAIIAAKMTPLVEAHTSQVAKMQAQIDELGQAPDPAMAPVRGQMARPGNGAAAPVEKRSLMDEAQSARMAKATQDQRDYLAYVIKQADSPDPNTRERARALLDQMAGEPAHVPA
jgi:hypothetical protein